MVQKGSCTILDEDPGQLSNLWAVNDHQEIKSDLIADLWGNLPSPR